MPTLDISSVMPKFIDETKYISSTFFSHGFECFWWHAIKYCRFHTFKTVDSPIKYIPGYRVIKVTHIFSLFDKSEYSEVRRLMIFEYFFKVRVPNSHILLVILCHFSILLLHVHIICLLVILLLSALQDINALPSYS